MPSRWIGLWQMMTPAQGHAPKALWPWLVAAGALVLMAVTVVWLRIAWGVEQITTEFLVLTSFVILIGLALLKSRKEKDGTDGHRSLENADTGSHPGRDRAAPGAQSDDRSDA